MKTHKKTNFANVLFVNPLQVTKGTFLSYVNYRLNLHCFIYF